MFFLFLTLYIVIQSPMINLSALVAELHVLQLHSWNMGRERAVMIAYVPQSVFLMRENVSLL